MIEVWHMISVRRGRSSKKILAALSVSIIPMCNAFFIMLIVAMICARRQLRVDVLRPSASRFRDQSISQCSLVYCL